MRNGGFWFKVKVLSFKIRFCNWDSDAQLTPTTAHAQTLAVIAKKRRFNKTRMITIQELLFNRGLEANSKIKLVRHKDNRRDLYTLYRTDKAEFLAYQNAQVRDVFNGLNYIVSFIGEEGLLSRFIGVYRLIFQDPTHATSFQFSILMLLPRTITADEAIKKERLFKNKLGTNSFGLNNN